MYAEKLSRRPVSRAGSGTRSTHTTIGLVNSVPALDRKSSAWRRSRVSRRPCSTCHLAGPIRPRCYAAFDRCRIDERRVSRLTGQASTSRLLETSRDFEGAGFLATPSETEGVGGGESTVLIGEPSRAQHLKKHFR